MLIQITKTITSAQIHPWFHKRWFNFLDLILKLYKKKINNKIQSIKIGGIKEGQNHPLTCKHQTKVDSSLQNLITQLLNKITIKTIQ